jgi:molybdate transport system substrate-binding protein
MNAWKAVLFASATSLASSAMAAELQVLAGGGIAAPLNEIATSFEKKTGHKLVIRYGTAPQLVAMATGTPHDLCVVPVEVMKSDAARAAFVPNQVEVARVGMGVAVKAGAPKPDISTPEALKGTLLGAKSIASIPASATGVLLAQIYERLGITEEMKARIKAQPTPAAIAQSVANGESDLAVFLTNVITAPGVDLVGPFPPEVQLEVVYTGALSVGTKQAEAAKAFLAYVLSPEAAAVIRSKGMVPSSPR